MSVFCCPVCNSRLDFDEIGAFCNGHHRFDRARQGYFNLLRSQSSSSKHHGDDRLMVDARRNFLSKGYYEPLRNRICELIAERVPQDAAIADVGCGEGYYTSELVRRLGCDGIRVDLGAVDISKESCKLAARILPKNSVAVASAFDLPMGDASCDVLLNIFAPIAAQEYHRVIKQGGYLIRGVPRERHLFGLKAGIYATPYLNPPVTQELAGFSAVDRVDLDWTICLDSSEDIMNLFMMTPYYYKTSAADQERLRGTSSLETELSFAILIDRRV